MQNMFKIFEVALNVDMFKALGYERLFNPKSPKIFNYHVYKLIFALLSAIIMCLSVYGMSGFFTKTNSIVNQVHLLQVICGEVHVILSSFKVIFSIYNANKIRLLFDSTSRTDLFISRQAIVHMDLVYSYRKKSRKIINMICYLFISTTTMWFIYPLLLNKQMATHIDLETQRYENILNLPFPVTTDVYNNNYSYFYLIEFILIENIVYGTFLTNILIIGFAYDFIVQYEIHALAFSNIFGDELEEREKTADNANYYDNFKTMILDQQNLASKLQSYYSIAWFIIVSSVIGSSGLIVMFSYTFVLIFMAAGSVKIINIFKFAITILFFSLELFIHCHLLDNINVKKEYVTFGMYCSDWTKANLKFKKLLLQSMRINDTNRTMIKVSPLKIINLNFFANVILRCFNIVSVMVKYQQKILHAN